jgi:pimaricinolide synthase PimS1
VRALPSDEGLELLDVAWGARRALVLAARLDATALRAQARAGLLPALLRGLIRTPPRRAGTGERAALAERLRGLSEQERRRVVLELVRGEAAVVLGHASPATVPPDRAFKALGFDSLTAVELRNRLDVATGLRLPATLVFDHPSAAAIAGCLLDELARDGASTAISTEAELAELERRLSSIAADAAGRAQVTARLQALLSGLQARERAPGDDEDVRSATADEVFDLIDRELGPVAP